MEQRWAWTHRHGVSLFVVSLVAVVVTGAGLVGALVAFQGDSGERAVGADDSTGGPDAPPSDPAADPTTSPADPTASPPAGSERVDDCLLGRWQLLSHVEMVDQLVSDPDEVTLDRGAPELELRADGTGELDYGDDTRLVGDSTVAELAGPITFEYEAGDGTLHYLDWESDATLTLEVGGVSLGSQPGRLSSDPFHYECTSDTLTSWNPEETVESVYTRIG